MDDGIDDRRARAVARAVEAARNNAEWCDTLCRTHGVQGAFSAAFWASAVRTPPLYPDAVTLVPGASAAGVLAGIDTAAPGCTVKDSFAELDLSAAGFEVLFDAEWIHRPAELPAPAGPAGVCWAVVRAAQELAEWERAWGGGADELFRAGLLGDASTLVLAGRRGGRVVAGAVLTLGDAVVGVSNLFAADGDLDAAWAGCLSEVARHRPDAPVVGYEHGPDLAAALRLGFTAAGPLRVWLHTGRPGRA
ncbi:hypothetical protein AB0436_16085 [Streptomyces sp. NPDC051322]|uniref:hypothetical protein n=1 Tax=Streptomyces sp. NPDC051322 TaxID=3154645 RepID=UPI00344EBF0F